MKTRTLLLVEDDPQDEKLTLRALAKIHVANRVDVVRDGAEALDYLFSRGRYHNRKPGQLPTAMLLDIKLPKLSGLEVLARIRCDPLTKHLPVVILTSSDDEQDLSKSYDLGVNSYVRKPLDPGEFTTAVAEVGLYWLAINEPPPDDS